MITDRFYEVVSLVSLISLIAPLSISLIKIKTLNATLRVLLIYFFISVIAEILSRYENDKNLMLYDATQNTFTILECFCFSIIFYLQFTSRSGRTVVQILLILYLLLAMVIFWSISSFFVYNNTILVIESLMMIVFSVSFFYKVYSEQNIQALHNYFFFWINSGILIYFSASFFIFLFDGYLTKLDPSYFSLLHSIHQIANIATNSLFAIGIWKTTSK
jgi:hypothetical protein